MLNQASRETPYLGVRWGLETTSQNMSKITNKVIILTGTVKPLHKQSIQIKPLHKRLTQAGIYPDGNSNTK